MQKKIFQTVLGSLLLLGLSCLEASAVDVTTLAGNGVAAATDGTGYDANFNSPTGADLDSGGNLFVVDTGNHSIRKITPAGVVTTFAGTGAGGAVDANGTSASFQGPTDLVIDSSDNVFVADSGNHTIRKISPAGVVRTFAGKPGVGTSINGPRGAATFNNPTGIGIDNGNNLYVAEATGNLIRKITPTGVVTTIAGNGTAVSYDDTGTAAGFYTPYDVAMAGNGNLYVAEYNSHTIRKITSGGVVTTLAGTAGVTGAVDDTGAAASFNYPSSIVVDSSNDLYVSDTANHTIRKITAAGVVTTPTGIATTSGSVNGSLATATYSSPRGLGIASNGALLLADSGNHMIRKIVTLVAGKGNPSGTPDTLPDGVVSTLAGNGVAAATDGTGADANFNSPTASDVDSSGNLFLADTGNHSIRKITPAGVVTTFAGTGGAGAVDANGTSASFSSPTDLVIDSSDNVFVADSGNHTIRKISPAGVVRTFAGKPGVGGTSINGVRGAATFNSPTGIGIDNGNNLYVAEATGNLIRKITPVGVVTTIAGNGTAVSYDDTGTAAGFYTPYDVAMAGNGNLYVAEYNSHTIRKITSGGVVTTLAGSAGATGDIDATGSSARLNYPTNIALDNSNNIYLTDTGNHLVRKVTPAGVVTTVTGSSGDTGADNGPIYDALLNGPRAITIAANASILLTDSTNHMLRKIVDVASGRCTPSGTPDSLPAGTVTTFAGNGVAAATDGTGAAANFNAPSGGDLDSSGNLFIADTGNHNIRKITPAGVVTTFAGTGVAGAVDDTGTAASFSSPTDIAIDSSNNLFVTDTGNHNIRKITPAGVVTTFAGTGGTGSTDDTGTSASFNAPAGIGIDSSNNLYVADTANHTIRKITTGAVVTTLAGSAGNADSTNGTGAAARFSSPTDIVMAGTGDLYVTDTGNHTIRKVTTGGVVTKLAGTTGVAGDADATGTSAQFSSPGYITVDPDDSLFVSDTGNHIIRKVTLAGVVTTPTGSSGDTGFDNGPIYSSLYSSPKGLAINSSCHIFVGDASNHSVRKIADLASGCSAAPMRRRMIISSYLKDLFKLSKNRTLINHQVQE